MAIYNTSTRQDVVTMLLHLPERPIELSFPVNEGLQSTCHLNRWREIGTHLSVMSCIYALQATYCTMQVWLRDVTRCDAQWRLGLLYKVDIF